MPGPRLIPGPLRVRSASPSLNQLGGVNAATEGSRVHNALALTWYPRSCWRGVNATSL
jgi:hypothetical protein